MSSKHPKHKYPQPGSDETPQSFPGIEKEMVTKPVFDSADIRSRQALKDKVAIVTGGDSGIGRAIVIAFAKEGAKVAFTSLAEESVDTQETSSYLADMGATVHHITADFNDINAPAAVIKEVIDTWGALDILVNNAALQKHYETISEVSAADFETIYRINVVAPFCLIQEAVKYMQSGASIINTVSIQAYDPSFMLLPYAASKGALVEMTKGLASQLMKQGIRINAVAPGPIWSPLNTHGAPEGKLKKFGESTLFERPGQPVELSPVYVLLASDEASYITGEIYGVTGGRGIA